MILEKATAQTQGGNGSSVNGSSVNESEVNESAEESGRITVNADIVVGADGAGSKTRRLLQELVRLRVRYRLSVCGKFEGIFCVKMDKVNFLWTLWQRAQDVLHTRSMSKL